MIYPPVIGLIGGEPEMRERVANVLKQRHGYRPVTSAVRKYGLQALGVPTLHGKGPWVVNDADPTWMQNWVRSVGGIVVGCRKSGVMPGVYRIEPEIELVVDTFPGEKIRAMLAYLRKGR